MSIRKRLVTFSLVLAIVPVLVVEAVVAYVSFDLQSGRTLEDQARTAEDAAAAICVWATGVRRDLALLVHVCEIQQLDLAEQESLLSGLLSHRDVFSELALVDGSGRERVRVSSGGRVAQESRAGADEFEMPTESGTGHFGPVWFDETTGVTLLRVVEPLRNLAGPGFSGALVADVWFEGVSELLVSLPVIDGTSVYLVNAQSRVVARRDPSAPSIGAQATIPREAGIVKSASGSRVCVTPTHFRLGSEDFAIIVERPLLVAMAQPLGAGALVAVCVILPTLTLAYFVVSAMTRRIVAPIQALSETAKAIREGDLSRRVEVVDDDEVGALSDSFNSMTDRLQASLESLEREVAERKRTEDTLRKREGMFRAITEDTTDGTVILDANGDLIYASPSVQSISGYLPEEIVGNTPERFLYAESVPVFIDTLRQVLETPDKTPGLTEFRVRHRDGQSVYIEGLATGMLDVEGVNGIVFSFRDITERRHAEEERRSLEEQVQRAQRMESLGILAGGIAHDFNNILGVILGHADLVFEGLPRTSPLHKSVLAIERGARQAARLTEQMLAYSGHGRFVVELVDLSEAVEDLVGLLEASVSKKVSLNLDLKDDLLPIESDATQIQQIVMNLITNASEAIGNDSGAVWVRTRMQECADEYLAQSYLDEKPPAGTYVYLEVTDTGCGMDAATIGRMFDPFYTTKFTGRGLGMSATLGIVRAHNGAIIVQSDPGEGSTFRILFPASRRKKEEKTEGSTSEPATAAQFSGTVLVIDDERDFRDMIRRALETRKFSVIEARDGREGVELYRDHADEVVCVLLDLTMPQMDGVETFHELRRICPEVKVILLSGYSQEDITDRFVDGEPAGFIQKPFKVSTLTSTLTTVLGDAHP